LILFILHIPCFFCSAVNACKQLGIPTVLTLSDVWLLCPRGLVTSANQLCDGPQEGKKCMKDCHYNNEVLTRYKEAKSFFSKVDRIFASSHYGRRTYIENNWNKRMPVIHYTRDYSNVKPEGEPNQLVFGFMGSLIWHKGPDVLVKAFKNIENENIKLKIYGKGDQRDPYYKDLIDLAKNDSRIELCGTFDHDNLPKIMKEFSVVVVPSSYKDNYPLVIQESLAFQKPVIGTNHGGIPEAIQNGVNGYLFEPRNIDQLTKILKELSDNPEKIQQLKKGIQPPARIEMEALQYENVYRDLLDESSNIDASHGTNLEENFSISHIKNDGPKLLIVGHNLNLEGAPKWLFFLARGLKNKGYDITVVSPTDGALKDYYILENIDVVVDEKFFNNLDIDKTVFEYFDIVLLNTLVNSIFVEHIHSVSVPTILHIHESERDIYMAKKDFSPYFKNVNSVVFSANATKKIYSDLEVNNNFTIIRPSIDFDEIESFKSENKRENLKNKFGLAPEDKVITIVGTIIERKGQMTLVDAAIKLLDSGKKNLHFFIVGAIDNHYTKKINTKIEKNGYSKNIHVIPISNPLEYYLMSDLFVCCSLIESYPNVIMEAMAFELPIISTDVFGIPEQITNEEHGILIKPSSPDLLAEKIQLLIEKPELAKKYAKNAYNRISTELTLDKAIKSYDDLIKEILKEKKVKVSLKN